MAYISNQPLGRGEGKRRRRYVPVPARLQLVGPDGSWDKDHDVFLTLRLRRGNGEFVPVHLDSKDAGDVARWLTGRFDTPTLQQMTAAIFARLDDDASLEALRAEMIRRKPNRKRIAALAVTLVDTLDWLEIVGDESSRRVAELRSRVRK